MRYPNFLIGENLPVNESDIQYYNLGDNYFYEINNQFPYKRVFHRILVQSLSIQKTTQGAI